MRTHTGDEHIIKIRNLTKYYGKELIIDHMSLDICKGQITAILGPNGSGKSTLLNILCTDLPFDDGQVDMAGHKLGKENRHIRQNIGVVFQNSVLDERLTVIENLRVRGSLYGLKGRKLAESIENAAAITNIKELLTKEYGKLSGGQKRRCDIARALIHRPRILFLDEPTSGLDYENRNRIWRSIEDIKDETGMTVITTTHYMEETRFADNIIVIDKGRINDGSIWIEMLGTLFQR